MRTNLNQYPAGTPSHRIALHSRIMLIKFRRMNMARPSSTALPINDKASGEDKLLTVT